MSRTYRRNSVGNYDRLKKAKMRRTKKLLKHKNKVNNYEGEHNGKENQIETTE